jgi:hypothetical protein
MPGTPCWNDLATVDALPELVAQTSFTRDMELPLQLCPLVRYLLDGAA